MAEVRALGTHITWLLTREELIGRSSQCDWQLPDVDVSARHASLRWTGKVWELQDLSSRNGTFVRGQRLAPGVRVTLLPGMRIRFGTRGPEWSVVDTSPPRTLVIRLQDQTRVPEQAGMIALPVDGDPQLLFYRDDSGQWVCEENDSIRPVADGQTFSVAGEPWRLRTETPVDATYESVAVGPALQSLQLNFRVSADEEHVRLDATLANHHFDVAPRAHHYLLLVLARARLADMQAAPEASASHGWVHHEQLSKMLRKSPLHINVEIHRARQQFAELGIAGASSLVERRRDTGELRIGCAQLSIGSL